MEDEGDDDEVDEGPAPRARASGSKSAKASRNVFFALLVVGSVVSLGYHFSSQYARERNKEIKRHLDVASEQLKNDSFASYKLACEAAAKALAKFLEDPEPRKWLPEP